MPFTIYHLSLIFRLPIVFCLSVPGASNESLIHASSVFEPDTASKEANLARARIHFQTVLRQVESLLRSNPYLWFNPIPQAAEPFVRILSCRRPLAPSPPLASATRGPWNPKTWTILF